MGNYSLPRKSISKKEYRFLRVDRRGRISINAKGDSDELKFTSLQFKVI